MADDFEIGTYGEHGALRRSLLALVRERGYTRSDEPFVLSSGGTSRDYVDLRRAVAQGADLAVAARAVLAHLDAKGVAFDAIGGMTMGADPVAHAAALLSGASWFSVRKAEKSHGAKRRIEGASLTEDMAVVLFEDTVSTGRSLLEALEVVRATGTSIVACLTLLDRGDAAASRFAACDAPYEALLTYRDLGIEPLSSGDAAQASRGSTASVDLLDLGIAVVALAAMAHGARLGAAVQLLTWAGFFAGLVLGSLILLVVEPHIGGQSAKTFVALAVLMVCAAVLAGAARQAGFVAWRAIRKVHFGLIDALAGALLAGAGVLAVCWLLAGLVGDSSVSSLDHQIGNSAILHGVDRVMPPLPSAFGELERYLSSGSFPEVVVDALPPPFASAPLATRGELASAVGAAGPSTVKIVALGCGDEQEGSGFAVASGLYVTNAHVVAGTRDITVLAPDGRSASAQAILFDPRFDLAVLRTTPLGVPPLRVDHGYVGHGAAAVVLGYPDGGPFDARRAGVVTRFSAVGRDIYDNALTTRTVYQLQAVVRPGNSGGPLVTPSGEVVGVVFSRSASDPDVGYALASPGVVTRVARAEHDEHRVSTEGCTG